MKVSEVTQSCPTLCDPMDCSLPGSSVHGIFQAIALEWIAISFSRGSSQPRDWTRVSRILDRRFTFWATREVLGVYKPRILVNSWNYLVINILLVSLENAHVFCLSHQACFHLLDILKSPLLCFVKHTDWLYISLWIHSTHLQVRNQAEGIQLRTSLN